MKKLILLLLISAGVVAGLQAQQERHYTQFMYNKLLINPAYSGARGVPFATAIYRNQWMGFDGAPKSVLASFNSPFISPRVGVGVTMSHFQIGLDKEFAATMAYSYDLIGQEEFSLRAGIMGSVRSLSTDFTKAMPANTGGDQSLDTEKNNSFYANVGAGLYATISSRFYIGLSMPRMYSNDISFNNPSASLTAKEYQHFYAMAGAILPLNEDFNLMPAFLVKYVKNAPLDIDLNVNLEIREKFTAGLSYRVGGDGPGESVDLLLFWKAHPQFGVGVAYDVTLSDVKDYSAGSIELLLQVDLKRSSSGGRNKPMSNPRFFM
jgi:type IX secretion system PorP/SprF family membrane protein